MKEVHIFVSGKVQGVGFRAQVHRHALIFDIKGYAVNLGDGRVEICAQGQRDSIERFIELIKTKPGLAQIDDLVVKSRPLNQKSHSFDIR